MADTRFRVYGKGGQTAVALMFVLAIGAAGMALATALPKFKDLRGAAPWMFVAAAALCVIGWVLSRALAYRIEVVDGKLRVLGRTPIDVGVPRKLRRGQFSVRAGESSVTAWLAVEGATEKPVVFMAPLGMLGSIDWPKGDPPAAHAELYVGPSTIRKLEHAVSNLV